MCEQVLSAPRSALGVSVAWLKCAGRVWVHGAAGHRQGAAARRRACQEVCSEPALGYPQTFYYLLPALGCPQTFYSNQHCQASERGLQRSCNMVSADISPPIIADGGLAAERDMVTSKRLRRSRLYNEV